MHVYMHPLQFVVAKKTIVRIHMSVNALNLNKLATNVNTNQKRKKI